MTETYEDFKRRSEPDPADTMLDVIVEYMSAVNKLMDNIKREPPGLDEREAILTEVRIKRRTLAACCARKDAGIHGQQCYGSGRRPCGDRINVGYKAAKDRLASDFNATAQNHLGAPYRGRVGG
jgi:hypothetical protein